MTLKVAGRHSIPPRRHSSESWNPVVYAIHSRASGNDNVKDWLLFPLPAAGRADAGGFLGGLFQTPLYHLRPVGELSLE